MSPEESPVFNCSSLLTTSRDQDSECVRLGPGDGVGSSEHTVVMEREAAVGGSGCAWTCVYTRVDSVLTGGHILD